LRKCCGRVDERVEEELREEEELRKG